MEKSIPIEQHQCLLIFVTCAQAVLELKICVDKNRRS